MIKHLQNAFIAYTEITGDATLKGFMKMLDKYENTRSGRVMTIVFENKTQKKQFKELLELVFKSWCVDCSYYRISHYMGDVEEALKGFNPQISTTKIDEIITEKEMV